VSIPPPRSVFLGQSALDIRLLPARVRMQCIGFRARLAILVACGMFFNYPQFLGPCEPRQFTSCLPVVLILGAVTAHATACSIALPMLLLAPHTHIHTHTHTHTLIPSSLCVSLSLSHTPITIDQMRDGHVKGLSLFHTHSRAHT